MPRKKATKKDEVKQAKEEKKEEKKEEWEKIVEDRGVVPDEIPDEEDEKEGREIPFHPWAQNFKKVTQEDEPEYYEDMTNVTTYSKEGLPRTELDTSIVKKLEIVPDANPKKTTVTFFMQKEEGDELIPYEALNGMLICSITEEEYYMSIAGDPLPSVLFFANELRSPTTFIWNLVVSGFTFAIGDSDYEQLANIHNVLDELQNMVLDRYSVLKEKDIRDYLGLEDDEPIPDDYKET